MAVTGGIPTYLEQVDSTKSAEDNIQRLCFKPSGFLFREFNNLFHDLFQEKKFYRDLLTVIAKAPIELEGIYRELKLEKSGYISEAIDDLIETGFLSRDYTWAVHSAKQSNLSKIRISDNYTRFYFNSILPNQKKIIRGHSELPINIYSILGLQFENIILKNRAAIWNVLNISPGSIVMDGSYFQRETKQKIGCQIDYLIQCRNNTLYVIEIKFRKTSIKMSVVKEIENKIAALSKPKGVSCRPILVHVNGVDDSVEECEYFDEIIDFGALMM